MDNEKREHFIWKTHSLQDSAWKQLWIINTTSLSNHRLGSCHCCENIAKPMYVQKKTRISGDYCNPSLPPFKEGTKTINVICCSRSQSSRFVGNLEVPPWVIKHSGIIPWPGAFPHIHTLINPGSWTKLDFIPLSQLWTLGSTFSLCVF